MAALKEFSKNPNTRQLLDFLVLKYNHKSFIPNDPISIPHQFSKKQDIEISGLFAAILAWGQRTSILNSLNRLMALFENAPFDYILNHREKDNKRFEGFVHRTFNATDLLYFVERLKVHYQNHKSLESAFSDGMKKNDETVQNGLIHFHDNFFSMPHLSRTRKHIASPERNSACKRLNLYLRWMVRSSDTGVDFGIWKNISPSQLICPLDIHVHRSALSLGLMDRNQSDWKAAVELTSALKKLNPADPVIYDFALFGFGLENKK